MQTEFCSVKTSLISLIDEIESLTIEKINLFQRESVTTNEYELKAIKQDLLKVARTINILKINLAKRVLDL